MNKETKIAISTAATRYMEAHQLSQNAVATSTGINISYLNSMLAGETAIRVKDKPVAIAVKWWAILATYIGYAYQKEYWPFVPTAEFEAIINVLTFAKEQGFTNVIICGTGAGKTHAVEKFEKKHPNHTYVITVSRVHKITEILSEFMERLGIPAIHSNSVKLKRVINKIRDIRLSGNDPILIIDEAENLTIPVLQMLKALYDGVKEYCAMVLIGTDQLTHKLDTMELKNQDGMPQFCRRFRAGRREITKANDFRPFFQALDITDGNLISLVTRLARNYGELRDYLEPALRLADRMDQPLTETLFRQFHYLPNY